MKLIEHGTVHPALLKLVGLHIPLVLEGTTWTPQALNALLQGEWVKAQNGVYRAQLGGRFPTEEEQVLLDQLGAAAIPIDDSPTIGYLGTLLLGATLKAITRRVKSMDDWHDLIVSPVYSLGSRRPLDPKLESPEQVPAILEEVGAHFSNSWSHDRDADDWPRHELAMMNRVQEWMRADWKREFVLAPDSAKPDGSSRPANTGESVKAWLDHGALPGRYLVVSSQPFCQNQLMAVERAVREAGKERYTFDVCGPAAPPLPLSRWFDNLAKQLWEEVELLPK